MEFSFIAGPVAEEYDRDVALFFELSGDRCAAGDRQSGSDDAVRSQHADAEVRDVHGAALAFAVAGFLAVDFGHHPLHVRAFGDAMAVSPVIADDAVLFGQVRAHSGGDRFLADVGVDETEQVSGIEFRRMPAPQSAG